MTDSPFPSEIPNVGDLLRITPVIQDYVVRNYKFFCVEAYVTSRFYALDYTDRRYIEVWLGSQYVPTIRFNLEALSWSANFDNQITQMEVEKILE